MQYPNFVDDLPLSEFRNLCFQHDDAPLHKVSSVQQYLRNTFQQQMIGYGKPIGLFSVGIPQAESVCNPSTSIAGTSKPYYECLCQRVTYHVVQCASRSSVPCPDVYCCWRTPFWTLQIDEPHFRHVQFCSMWRNKCAFCAFLLCHFCARDADRWCWTFLSLTFPVACTVFEIKMLT